MEIGGQEARDREERGRKREERLKVLEERLDEKVSSNKVKMMGERIEKDRKDRGRNKSAQ
jgi:hypothetical protein